MGWIRELAVWMTALAETSAGPWALFWLSLAEASFFPLPPVLLLLALDVLNPPRSFVFAAICTAGSTVGGMLGYAIGRWGGQPMLRRMVSETGILNIQQRFQQYDVWAVGLAGFTPIPYKVFTIAAGTFQLRFWRFVLVSVFSRGARFFLVSGLVYAFGQQAKELLKQYFNLFTIAFAVLLIGGFVVVRWALHRGQTS